MANPLIPEIVINSSTRRSRSGSGISSLAERRAARDSANRELIRELINNPVVELIAGIVAISYLNKGSGSWLESLTGIDLKAGGEYAGLVAIIGLQQIAPLAGELIKSPAAADALKALPLAALAL